MKTNSKQLPPLTSALMLQFLDWVASRDRTHAEAMEAWRTSCPRMTIWEDAIDARLIRLKRAEQATKGSARVFLTSRGHALLESGRTDISLVPRRR
jgi:hypothetical protein